MKAIIFTAKIKDVRQLGKDTRHFRLEIPKDTAFSFKAGQFVNFLIQLPGAEKGIKRPYSIASAPSWPGIIDFVWKRVEGGTVTNYLWDLREGGSLQVQGPLGIFTVHEPMPKTIIFISTGTGVAPFRSMIHELLYKDTPVEIWNIFGNRFEDEILYREEFEELEKKHSNFKNFFTVSRPKNWKGETGYVQTILKKHAADPKDKHIYICGLSKMIQEVRDTAAAIGFTKEQIFFEKYD